MINVVLVVPQASSSILAGVLLSSGLVDSGINEKVSEEKCVFNQSRKHREKKDSLCCVPRTTGLSVPATSVLQITAPFVSGLFMLSRHLTRNLFYSGTSRARLPISKTT